MILDDFMYWTWKLLLKFFYFLKFVFRVIDTWIGVIYVKKLILSIFIQKRLLCISYM